MNTVKNNGGILSQLMKLDPQAFGVLRVGDLVEGKVLEKRAHALLLDLGKFGTGMVYRGELQNAREMVRGLSVGDTIHAKIVELDNEEGYVELSLAEAGKQKAWGEVLELREKGEAITVKPNGFNKGGLTTELCGLMAFIPVSQLGNEHYPKVEDKTDIGKALQLLVGQELTVKIIDANPRTNKLILSEREAQEISAKELVKNYTIGQIIEGIVSGVADFGVFVRFTDNPSLEGLIHVSELAHRMVENPKEVVKIDDAIKAQIIEIKDGKISLSLKTLQPNPWDKAAEYYKEGGIVRGIVYSTNPFGAIINLAHDLQGQLRVTDFGGIEEMKQNVTLGKEYEFKIEAVNPEEKRIVLTLKK